MDALKTTFYSRCYITQPIGDKSHEILCKLEDIQRTKLEAIRNAPAPLPLGVKSTTCDDTVNHHHQDSRVSTEVFGHNLVRSGSSREMALMEEDDDSGAMIEEEDETTSPISSWI